MCVNGHGIDIDISVGLFYAGLSGLDVEVKSGASDFGSYQQGEGQ